MADTEAQPAQAPAAATPAKKGKGGAKAVKKAASPKKPRAKTASDHPKISVMVNGAIKGLGERGGSSFKAIKKYMHDNYKVDAEKLAPFVRRYLKSGVASGALVQVKGKGANGSFRLAAKGGEKKAAAAKPKKAASPKKPKAASAAKAKKPASPKKKAAAKPKKAAAPTGAASPAKPKKAAAKKPKSPAAKKPAKPKTSKAPKKPKSPKPKKATSKPKAATKKAAPKKK